MYNYDNRCGSCEYLKDMRDDNTLFEGDSDEKGHCIILKSCYYPDDYVCTYYKDRNSCYITTVVCELLGFSDNCGVLNSLRYFRNNIMQKDPTYKAMLYEYDVVGPKIAKNLIKDFKDSEDNDLVYELYNFYISPTARLVDEKKYSEAVSRYSEMTNALREYYHIDDLINVEEDYDYKNGGHGVKKLGTIGD